MRMKDKVGIVVGAGQTAGETIGNGRAAAILLAREGAKVLLVDRDLKSAEDTAAMIAKVFFVIFLILFVASFVGSKRLDS